MAQNGQFMALYSMDSIELGRTALIGIIILLALLGIVYIGARPKARGKKPPGPRGLPILGNALQIPNQVSCPQCVVTYLETHIDYLAPCNVLPLTTPDLWWPRIAKPRRQCAHFFGSRWFVGLWLTLISAPHPNRRYQTCQGDPREASSKLFRTSEVVLYCASQLCTKRLFLQAGSQENYVDPNKIYWVFHDQTPTFHVARKLTAGVMSSVRAGLTEPLHHFESLRSIQLLLNDGGKDWLSCIKMCTPSL